MQYCRGMGKLRAIAIIGLLGALGCAAGGEDDTTGELLPPEVAALSTYQAPIGTLIEVYGSHFPSRSDAQTMLVFRGTFDAEDGTSHPVNEAFETTRLDGGTLRWDDFGPYRVPFGPGDRIGTFHGQVMAQTVGPDGEVLMEGEPLDISFRVQPSIMVHELQPVTASCGGPVKRGLGGAAYRVRVQALGFEPTSFTYTIAAPAVADFEPVSVRHAATGRFDTVGEYGDFIMPQVPSNLLAYGAVLTIQATDGDGALHQSSFAIGVHRPLEVYYNGNVGVAEIFAPTPVSACIPGGETGRDVEYNESMSETRSRAYTLSWNESWLSSHTVSSSTSSTVGLSETNGVGFATTDGEAFRWSMGGEVGGTIGISELVSLGVKANFGIENETSRTVENSRERETGLTRSETTTDTESATDTVGGGTGESFSWEVSSTEAIARGFGGRVLPQTYGVFYRQTLRLLRRAVLVTYNQCGAAEVVGEVDFTDWAWSPDLALGSSCPPLPESNLPEAECIISPCSGE